MNNHKWGTKGCLNEIKYYNEYESFYYWKSWAIQMFREGECTKIGSFGTITQVLSLCKGMLDEVQRYIKEEQLEEKWRLDLDSLNFLNIEYDRIVKNLDDSIIANNLKDLTKIMKRAFDLKSHILENIIFLKYLIHKEMNMLRLRNELKDDNQIHNYVDNISKEIVEEVKTPNRKGILKENKPMKENSSLNSSLK